MRVTRLIVLASLGLAASGCIRPDFSHSIPGISLKEGQSDPYLQDLLRRAQRDGDKYAMLELGRRYEHGQGVPVNWKLAEQFYGGAAVTNGGSFWSLSTFGTPTMRNEPYRKGLPEARALYDSIRARRKAQRQ